MSATILVSRIRIHTCGAQSSTFSTIGPSGVLSSFVGAFRYITHAQSMVQEGYSKHFGSIFHVPLFIHWTHVVTGKDHMLEVGSAADDKLSLEDAITEILQTDYTISSELHTNPYHVGVIRSGMMRNLARRFPDVIDEVRSAFEEVLALDGTEWKLISAYTAMMDIVCRTSNRLFVGLPLSKSPEYQQLNIHYTIDVVVGGQLIRMLPPILRPIIGPFLTSRKRNLRLAERLLGPLINARLQDEDPSSRPASFAQNDLISWPLDAATAEEKTVPALAQRILAVNVGAIHTSSMTFTHTIFDLAAYPHYLPPLRSEVEHVVAEEGWSKSALGKMYKIDSFLRESQRMNGLGVRGLNCTPIVVMPRKVVNAAGFTFSDGTVLPYGSFMEVAAIATHHDAAVYENPDTFDRFRFSWLREAQDKSVIFKHHMVTTAAEYLPFGHGRHACPGRPRFFAATELKAMLAHVVLNFDVKLDSADGTRPPNQSVASACIPNRTARLWFKRRTE
ncbi:cytochrome P450 [Mycena sp. CBHHK59/15]|nr:cytochrome P450 [Mycena sp. CBHHK59/15]